jgi:5'-3' exoribonuclease 2
MGVPGFFLWLMKKYKKEGFVFQKEKLTIQDIKKDQDNIDKILTKNKYNQNILDEINNMDYFLIDANCLIHPVCFGVLAENPNENDTDKLENKMMNAVIDYLNEIIDYVNPKKGVYLAIDGVAPIAKVKQQRSRRFKSVADKVLWDNIKKKHDRPINTHWNNSAITPGTVFMEKLNNRILVWAKECKRTIIYSSCFTPAEGEHKLLQYIRDNQAKNILNSYVIYGLDADLIFLALSTGLSNIYLLRESNEINKNNSKETFSYVSIKIMIDSIVSTIRGYLLEACDGLLNVDKITNNNEKLYGFDNLDNKRIINDFIFMCYFLGNDFLPHIPSLDIHNDGIEYLIINYAEAMSEIILETNNLDYLLNDNGNIINNDYLTKFIGKLAVQEEGVLRENLAKGKRRMKCDGDDYEKEIFKIENLQFKINDPIRLGFDSHEEWRLRYYKHYWNISDDELEEFSENLVINYLLGIKWVMLYYFHECPSWEWYYPYEHPPFISDINKYLSKVNMNKIKFSIGKPLQPYMQLLAVLPPQSNYLIPPSLRKLMTNPRSSLAHLYPTEFKQDFINKSKYWKGIPLLPPLDIETIKHSFNKYKDELTKEEIERNKIKNVLFF